MQVGICSSFGATGIDDDNFQRRGFFFCGLDTAKQHRMREGRIGASDEQTFGMIDVFITARRRVHTKCFLIARHGRGHA